MNDSVEQLTINAKKFNKIVIWGLRKKFHTHRYIFQGYYETLKKLGIPVLWVEDEKKNAVSIEKNDLVLSAEVQGKMVPEKLRFEDYHLPVRSDVYYCLHNYKESYIKNISPDKLLNLQVYVKTAEKYSKIKEGVHFDVNSRTIYQPWGTNLLPDEFKKPVFSRSKFVFWVGSVWNNAQNQGNINEINKLIEILKEHRLQFKKVRFVPDFLNIFLIRNSRIAPAIAGRAQVEMDYLPCRMFKNISYGQLGFSNVEKFNQIFRDFTVYDRNIEIMTEKVLSLTKEDYTDLVGHQQEVCKNYTYVQHLNNIFAKFN